MILFSDFDGTLHRRLVEGDFERNLVAVQKFRAAGNKFVLTTGRGLSSILRAFPNQADYADYLICDNGSVCLQGDKKLFELTIDEDLAREVVDFVQTLPHHEEFDIVYYRDGDEFEDLKGGSTKIRIWAVNPEIMEQTLAALRGHFGSERLTIFGGHNMVPVKSAHMQFLKETHKGAVDVMAADAGKERAIHRILKNYPGERVITVGDGANDQDMIHEFNGYIMDTAYEHLRSEHRPDHQISSVAALIERMMVFDDIQKRIGVDLFGSELILYTDGATSARVFSAEDEFLVKITDAATVARQREFLSRTTNDAFQKILCSSIELGYECFEFIDGVHLRDSDIEQKDVLKQVEEIVKSYSKYDSDGYGFLGDTKASWRDFLQDEIEYAARRLPNTSQVKVYEALAKIGDVAPDKYLLHGDFGAHNFLIQNGRIRVIDPMPLIGDPLYDYYFAILSNPKIFQDLTSEQIFGVFDTYPLDYKKALCIIALYVRTSRAAVYDLPHFKDYEKLYAEI